MPGVICFGDRKHQILETFLMCRCHKVKSHLTSYEISTPSVPFSHSPSDAV